MRVLLIEDDYWLATLEADLLTAAGYNVYIAHSALEAIGYVDEVLPDVIIADVLLAGSTIFTLLHELQSYHDTAGIPVVLCTSIAEHFSQKQLEMYGVVRVVDKTTMTADALVVAVKYATALEVLVSGDGEASSESLALTTESV